MTNITKTNYNPRTQIEYKWANSWGNFKMRCDHKSHVHIESFLWVDLIYRQTPSDHHHFHHELRIMLIDQFSRYTVVYQMTHTNQDPAEDEVDVERWRRGAYCSCSLSRAMEHTLLNLRHGMLCWEQTSTREEQKEDDVFDPYSVEHRRQVKAINVTRNDQYICLLLIL